MRNRGEHPTGSDRGHPPLRRLLATGAAAAFATSALAGAAAADPASEDPAAGHPAAGQPAAGKPTAGAPAPQARSVGSGETSAGAAPWAVALTDDNGNQFCGGTLVTPVKVVTAAHCTYDQSTNQPRPIESLRAVTGRADLRTTAGESHQVDRAWTDPDYQGFTQGRDVAVLTLSDPAPERPLPVVGQGETAPYTPGTRGRIYGWGRTSESAPSSPVLRSVGIPVAEAPYCKHAYPEFDPRGMFCAGLPQGGKDACGGDSGGPYVVDGRLVGIVSYGTGCGRPGYPGVYTKLSAYADEVRGQLQQ